MKYFLILISCLTIKAVQAQDYKNAAGIRFGNTDGVSYKRFVTDNGAVELMLGFGGDDGGLQLYSTYQWYQPIPAKFTENLFFYYGVGGHVGYINQYTEQQYYANDSTVVSENGDKYYYAIGVDGVLGIEYRIYTVPMTVGIEIKPYFEYYGLEYTQFNFWDFGFTVKYIF
jgi:hypothetical protein